MTELLEKVLTDTSARKASALRRQAAKKAQLGYGWAGDSEIDA